MPSASCFAAPYLLRSAVGIRAILGVNLTPLAIKALLVHAADPGEHDPIEVGWGKIPEDTLDIITCPDGVARVVYQGELKPSKYLRASLPLPKEGLTGNVRLKATFCYASPTDPQDAAAYTKAGLEVVFKPSLGVGRGILRPTPRLGLKSSSGPTTKRSRMAKATRTRRASST